MGVDLFLLLFQRSMKCGSKRQNMKNLAQRSSTESAPKRFCTVEKEMQRWKRTVWKKEFRRLHFLSKKFCVLSHPSAWLCTGLCEDGLKKFDGIVRFSLKALSLV